MRVRINCFDVLLFWAISYAMTDLFANWWYLSQCQYPMSIWLLGSYCLTISIRLMHFLGHYLSTTEYETDVRLADNIQDQAKINFNWSNDKALKRISFCLVAIMLPIFMIWTWVGIYWFSVSYQETPWWFTSFQQYSFILFWMIITFLWIIYAVMLFATYWVTYNRTRSMQKNIISLLRKIDFNDNELFENSRANLQIENSKRNDMIQILNEYGIYFMNYGLTQNEIVRFETQQYLGDMHGNTRWVIWINSFGLGERVRVYPGCGHLFHLKWSQLWLEIEGTCPIWFSK